MTVNAAHWKLMERYLEERDKRELVEKKETADALKTQKLEKKLLKITSRMESAREEALTQQSDKLRAEFKDQLKAKDVEMAEALKEAIAKFELEKDVAVNAVLAAKEVEHDAHCKGMMVQMENTVSDLNAKNLDNLAAKDMQITNLDAKLRAKQGWYRLETLELASTKMQVQTLNISKQECNGERGSTATPAP